MADCTEYRKVLPTAQPIARCKRGNRKKTQERTPQGFADDFLKQRFGAYVPVSISKNHRKIEKDFFNSLSHLCQLYGLEQWDYSGYIFPLNINMAYKETSQRIATLNKELGLAIVERENQSTTLATYKELVFAYRVFYVPVRPLFDLFGEREGRETSALVLSLFAYLYQILHIPSYAHPYSYLNGVYDMLLEFCEGDEDSTGEYMRAIKKAQRYGQRLHKKIKDTKNLVLFAERLKKFKPQTKWERKLKRNIKGFHQLYKHAPTRAIADNLNTALVNEDEDEEAPIFLEQYLSFIWDIDDCLMEQIIEHLNSCSQDATEVEAPCSMQFFDTPQQEQTFDLSFETKVFELLDELIYLLNNRI